MTTDRDAVTSEGLEGEEAELQQRVIYSLLGPAIAMAAAFGVPLKDLVAQVQVAYFEHLRQQGKTLGEVSKVLGVSERTAKRLSQQFKTSFLLPELEHNLPVRIEFMLRAEPMSTARLSQILKGVEPSLIEEIVARLADEGRLEPQPGRTVTWRVVKSIHSLVRDTWLARIGGLNSLLSNLGDTIYGRFFLADPRAFARTMTFHVRPEQYDRLQALFGAMVEEVAAIDKDAEGQDARVPVRLSLFFAPFEMLGRSSEDLPPEP